MLDLSFSIIKSLFTVNVHPSSTVTSHLIVVFCVISIFVSIVTFQLIVTVQQSVLLTSAKVSHSANTHVLNINPQIRRGR